MRAFFIFFLLTSIGLSAQQIDPDILDSIKLKAAIYHSDALIILHQGELIYEDYFGQEDRPRYIASAGKSLTSLAVGKLLDLGLIDSLDQPVHTFYPEWRQGKKQDVTIRMLLNHTSGLQNIANASIELEPAPDYRVKDVIQLALCAELSDDPGTKFSYNNKAVALLGGIVERASGLRFDHFMVEHFYKPMNIADYEWIRDEKGQPTAHGAFKLKAADFLKFGELMLNKGLYKGKRILSSKWIERSTQSAQDFVKNQGLLWWLWPKYYKRLIDHEIVEEWKTAGVGDDFISQMSPMLYQNFESNEAFYKALQETLGAKYQQILSQELGDNLRWAKKIIADEMLAYYASGYRGNWLMIVPAHKIVALRMADHEGFDYQKDDSFHEFLKWVAQLVK